jgi:hypothetical protein
VKIHTPGNPLVKLFPGAEQVSDIFVKVINKVTLADRGPSLQVFNRQLSWERTCCGEDTALEDLRRHRVGDDFLFRAIELTCDEELGEEVIQE